jgi:tyrosine-protein phosphatase YwqE
VIDIHSHILPGLDDGADCLEESLAMLRMAAEAGTTDIVASPHANDRYPYDPETVRSKIAEVQEASRESIKVFVSYPRAILSGQPVETAFLMSVRRRSRTWRIPWW